ncbi:MAG: hypothetical protein ACREGI_04530, partial [Candidatus Levyibacteriota bacterium]
SRLRPLLIRNDIYNGFLFANSWIKKFLPNVVIQKTAIKKNIIIFSIFEQPFRILQLWYMRKHKTSEIISNGFLAFHPKDYESIIIQKFREKIAKYV